VAARIPALPALPALTLALAALGAGLCCGAPASRAAAGAEPWCIVDDEGNAHCNYATSQDCLRAVTGGNRGFCNVNSSAPPAPATAPVQRKRRQ
jgi:hypothetical protein